MGGLVNVDHEEADDRMLEVIEYLRGNCIEKNHFPGKRGEKLGRVKIDKYISLSQC